MQSDAAIRPVSVALVLASAVGGTGQYVASLAAGLSRAGHAVAVYGPEATGKQFGFTELGAEFVPIEIPATPRPADMRAVRKLRHAIQHDAPQVIHAHGLRAGFVAGIARPDQMPLVVTWHNQLMAEGLRGQVYRVLERRVARSADVTMCVSRDLVERAAALGAHDARFATVVAPAGEPSGRPAAEIRAEIGLDADTPLILSVGRLHPQKAHDVLVAAAARWRDRQPRPVVAIAGTGPSFIDLAEQISGTGAPVVLLGHRTDVPDLLAAADIAVVTSVWEGQQLFAQEAMRAGVPLVVTRTGALPDLVGDAAIVVRVGDVDAVDAAVGSLLDDSAYRAEMATRARARAAALPTMGDEIREVRAVYAELTGDRR